VDLTIAALLTQDGITNGAIYALLALALVLVFTVTRIIWVPAGEFVAWGTLTLAGLQLGKVPGTVGLLLGMAIVAGAMETWQSVRAAETHRLPRRLLVWSGVPDRDRGEHLVACAHADALGGPGGPDAGRGHRDGAAVVPDCLSTAGRGERAGAADRLRRVAFRDGGFRSLVLRRRRLAHTALLVGIVLRWAASTSACKACWSWAPALH
jgi:hypothetical protein